MYSSVPSRCQKGKQPECFGTGSISDDENVCNVKQVQLFIAAEHGRCELSCVWKAVE